MNREFDYSGFLILIVAIAVIGVMFYLGVDVILEGDWSGIILIVFGIMLFHNLQLHQVIKLLLGTKEEEDGNE